MDAEIKNAVTVAEQSAQYDKNAKRLLGNKHILAYILVKTVDEFFGMNPEDVVPYIEGEPLIGTVPLEPGLTNKEKDEGGHRIVGLNTENQEINEGLIRFDIIFYVRMRDGISQIIVNIEAQKDDPSDYLLPNRAVFYASRLISSQKERDFVKMNYDDIKRVFSIWICMNLHENSLDYIHLTNEKLLGSYPWKGGLNLLNIVLIGITEEIPQQNDKYELHRLLAALLSMKMTAEEKLKILEDEYKIPVNDDIRKDVSSMCNLSQGLIEKGMEKKEEKIILNMYQNHFTLEQIALAVNKSTKEIQAIIEKALTVSI